MTDTRDCMGPELLPGLPELETPEQHTARVLVAWNEILSSNPPNHLALQVAHTRSGIVALYGGATSGGQHTFIGALANLLEALRALDT